jgi:tetratricopeptide (TPR) repeat protein
MKLLLSLFKSYKIAGQFQRARRLFLAKRWEEALAHFEKAAHSDGHYIFTSGLFRQSIWTYIGRAQYNLRRLTDARYSLELALDSCKDDHLARLYWGLTMGRSGDEANGVRAIEAAMKGLYEWLEYINSSRPLDAFWDPQREIRSAIENDLTMIANKKVNYEQIIVDAERLGQKIEDEIDCVRRQESRPNE